MSWVLGRRHGFFVFPGGLGSGIGHTLVFFITLVRVEPYLGKEPSVTEYF